MSRLNADVQLTAVGKDGVKITTRLTRNPLTTCKHPDPADPTYYCIRRAEHAGPHRYGVSVAGEWRWS